MSNLKDFLNKQNTVISEGYSQEVKGQSDFLKNIVNDESIKSVMEIGFNAGHSAELFLSSNTNIDLLSFDIGHHSYMKLGKEFIDNVYPNRHKLIIGNSLNTVPEYCKNNEDKKFDLIFIDGGHDYKVAKGDLLNCKKLAHDKTLIIMDDTMNKNTWVCGHNIGPNRTWKEAKESNVIKEIGSVDFERGRGHSWGYYIL